MESTPVLEVVESQLDAEDAIRASEPLPDALPVLPLREMVAFPETLTPLAVGQERSIKLVDDVLGASRMLAMVAARDPEDEQEEAEDDHYQRDDHRQHGAKASANDRRIAVGAIPGPADPPPTRLWTRGLPALRTWGSDAHLQMCRRLMRCSPVGSRP